MNDADRVEYVRNCEPLYRAWLASGAGVFRWVQENRAEVDQAIRANGGTTEPKRGRTSRQLIEERARRWTVHM